MFDRLSPTQMEILRYIGVGGTLFVIDFFIWISCVELFDWDPRTAQAPARTTGAAIGFLAHKYVSFRSQGHSAWQISSEGTAYVAVSILNIVLSPFVVYAFLELTPEVLLKPLIAKVAAEIIVVAWTYILLKKVFAKGAQN